MKQSMIIDKSVRVNVMLVFEGLPVQFYELVGTITWSMMILKEWFACIALCTMHKPDGQNCFAVKVFAFFVPGSFSEAL